MATDVPSSNRSVDRVLESLRTEVHVVARDVLGQEWRQMDFPRRDPYSRLYVVEEGEAELYHGDRHYVLQPNRMYIIPAQTSVRFQCLDRVVIAWCHFNAEVLGGLDLFAWLRGDFEVLLTEPLYAKRLMARMRRLFGSDLPGRRLAVRGMLFELLASYLPTVPSGEQAARIRKSARFAMVLGRIEAALASPLRIPELASMMGLTSHYFSEQFAACFGVSPARYVQNRRIERAQRLLLESDASLEQVAAETGFCDAFHLSKTFRRLTGMSPSQFRRLPRRVGP
jgi:AraC-like DNA-binding protein